MYLEKNWRKKILTISIKDKYFILIYKLQQVSFDINSFKFNKKTKFLRKHYVWLERLIILDHKPLKINKKAS